MHEARSRWTLTGLLSAWGADTGDDQGGVPSHRLRVNLSSAFLLSLRQVRPPPSFATRTATAGTRRKNTTTSPNSVSASMATIGNGLTTTNTGGANMRGAATGV